jgi:hypothetical protein
MRISARHLATVVSALVLVTPGPAHGAPDGTGSVELTITAPVDGTAMVEITPVDGSAQAWTVVHDFSDDETETIELVGGTYRISPRPMVVDDQRYVGRSDPLQVRVMPGRTVESSVEYLWSEGVQNLRATEVTGSSVSLDWDAERGEGTTVRRVEGDDAATRPGQGVEIPHEGTSLTDTGLRSGTTYTYSIFARPGDGAFGRTEGDPVTITVGTAPEQGKSGEPTFVLNPRTRIFSADDVASAAPTGDGVRLDLAADVPTPVPGTFLSLPISTTLEGGYLGEVVSVSRDGRTLELVPAAMGAAFDLYHLTSPAVEEVASSAKTQALAPTVENLGKETLARASRDPQRSHEASSFGAALGTVKKECSVDSDIEVSKDLDFAHAGHSDVTIDKYKVLFVDVPSAVTFDVGYTATMQGTVDVEAQNAVECGVALPNYVRQFSVYPVPLALEARPELGVSVSSAGAVSDLGFTATAGFEVDGHLGFTGDNTFEGDLIKTGSPTEPMGSGTLGVGVEVGGSVAFGPGVGTRRAGVLLGVGGELFIVDASVNVKQFEDAEKSTCIELAAASRVGIMVTLRAWLPGYTFDASYPVESLNGTFAWGGGPWRWPDPCNEVESPTDDVVGDGVTPVDDDLVGSSDQWGKVSGFVPGEDTWVLSTGRVQDAVGEPGFFASTDLGGAGDAALSALSGFSTYDATAYSVTVIPNGQTLKVRYAFASEEYPEYVGSSYNDVMAIFVDGENCAMVPGTQTPVAINTVNAWSHAEYYVDNLHGAAGYGTTMDGLTTPLTCSVPVTPGEPVTIRIAVADASDRVFDSAVALLDGGIWSE